FEDSVHGRAEQAPLVLKGSEGAPARRREAVVLAWRTVARVATLGLHEAVTMEPQQQRIDRALRREHAVHSRQLLHQLVAIARLIAEEREHAVLEDTFAELGRDDRHGSVVYHLLPCIASISARGGPAWSGSAT